MVYYSITRRFLQTLNPVLSFYYWTDRVYLRQFSHALIEAEKYDKVKLIDKFEFDKGV